MQTSWVQTIKLFFLQLTGLSRDALHIYAGMLVFVVGAALLKKAASFAYPLVARAGRCLRHGSSRRS